MSIVTSNQGEPKAIHTELQPVVEIEYVPQVRDQNRSRN